jgi:hypothetical protein
VLLFSFLWQANEFAQVTPAWVPPDENYHYRLALEGFEQGNPLWQVSDRAQTHSLGPVSRMPQLYHQALASSLELRPESIRFLPWLRAMNTGLSAVALVLLWLASLDFAKGRWEAAFAVCLVASHTIMLPFLAGAVNYDNLTLLLSHACLFLLVAQSREAKLWRIGALLILSAVGILARFVFLPLAAFVVIASLALWIFQGPWRLSFKRAKIEKKGTVIVVLGVLIFGIASSRSIENELRYGGFSPKCELVLSKEICEQNFAQFLPAVKRREQNKEKPRMNTFAFTIAFTNEIFRQWDDIPGHKWVNGHVPKWRTSLLFLAMVASICIAVRQGWRPWNDKTWMAVASFALFIASVVFLKNYATYLDQGEFGYALNARYLLPVYGSGLLCVLLPVFRSSAEFELQLSRKAWVLIFGCFVVSQSLRGRAGLEWKVDAQIFVPSRR